MLEKLFVSQRRIEHIPDFSIINDITFSSDRGTGVRKLMIKFRVYYCHFYFSKYPETGGYKVLIFAFFQMAAEASAREPGTGLQGRGPSPRGGYQQGLQGNR